MNVGGELSTEMFSKEREATIAKQLSTLMLSTKRKAPMMMEMFYNLYNQYSSHQHV